MIVLAKPKSIHQNILFVVCSALIWCLLNAAPVRAAAGLAASNSSTFNASGGIQDALRDRLDVPGFTPSLIHPRMCQNDARGECQEMVSNMKKHIRRSARRHLQPVNVNPNLGNIKVLVLMVQFADHGNRNLISMETVEEVWGGAIKDWFNVNSQGQYTVDPVVIDWRQAERGEQFYAGGVSGFTAELQQVMWPVLNELDNRPGWNWADFDSDQDGRLDSVVMLHSGITAVLGGEDCFGRDYLDRIWDHAWGASLPSTTWKSKDGSYILNGYAVNSVYETDCDTIPFTPGLTAHEYMHTMGLEDLYQGGDDLSIAYGVGVFDIMSHPYGADNSGTPGLLSTWSKMAAQWITPKLIVEDGDYTAKAAHDNLDAYRIDITPEGSFSAEYFLIENRQKIGFEEAFVGNGLLIVHVDDAADAMNNLGYPGQPGWPQNGNHYQVAVVPKDGLYQLEKGENNGDEGDLFVPGDRLGPGMQDDGSGPVYPNTDSYQSGFIVETGITIEVLEQVGTDITFRVGGIKQSASSGTTETNPTSSAATATPASETEADSPTPTDASMSQPSINPPVATPSMGPLTPGSPTNPPRWVLTRPPFATLAPFDFPEFPIAEADNVESNPESSNGGAGRVQFPGLVVFFAALCIIAW